MKLASRSSWSKKTPEQIAACSQKTLKTKLKKYGSVAPPRHKVTWKGGWREIGGRRIYFRSRWEANYARILEYKKNLGEIKDWEFEPDTFWFDKIKRGVVCYIPDFKITETDGSFYYIEIKGWMDARSKTKLKRMKKYHPNIRLILIEAKAYKDCLILYSTKIKNFE